MCIGHRITIFGKINKFSKGCLDYLNVENKANQLTKTYAGMASQIMVQFEFNEKKSKSSKNIQNHHLKIGQNKEKIQFI